LPHSSNVYDVLSTLGERWEPLLAANFRNAGLMSPAWLEANADLYRDFPDFVRREHSLHVIGREAGEPWLEVFEEFRASNDLIVVFSNKSRDELLDGLNLYLAWYAQPSTLKIALDEGSAHLARGLMTGIKAILLQRAAGEGWNVYFPPGVDVPIELGVQ
jgi:hypothetical protein